MSCKNNELLNYINLNFIIIGSYYKPKPKYCPKLKLPYGYVKHWGYSYGKKAVHYCDKCYKLYGDRVRVCKYGYWSGKKPVCKRKSNHIIN